MLKNLTKRLPRDKNRRFAVLLIALLALPITVVLVQRVVRYFTGAASATIYFEPSQADLPPDTTLRLMVNSGSTRVGFARVEVNFDRSRVRLTSEISTTNMLTMNNADVGNTSSLPPDACTGTQQCIIKTPMNAANNTGKIVLVLAKDPRVGQNAPSGTFELARFTFKAYTTSQVSTNVTIPSNQLVDMNAQKFNVSTQRATLSLNGSQATPTQGASPTPGGPQSPYPDGIPHAIPGKIEAENFDTGGEGVAYHDYDTGNNGSANYRSGEDVDLSSTSDSGGGYHIGWTEANEWVEYTVNVQSSGTYKFQARLANNSSGGQFRMEMDGSNLTGSIDAPNTGGWQNFQTVEKEVNLSSGEHIMRVYYEKGATGGAYHVGDYNWFNFVKLSGTTITSTPPSGCSDVPGDTNGDRVVNVLDILEVVANYPPAPLTNPCADLTGEGDINVLDILEVVYYYP